MDDIEATKSYLDFVRYCIDEQQCIPSIKDWDALFLFMQQQALLGVGFRGLERMKKAGVDVPRNVVLKWYAMSEQIKQANQKANKACVEVSDFFRAQGFRSCILKGQGNTLYYPVPYIRTSGDIDIWLEGGHDKIMNFVNDKWPGMLERYHHVEVPAWNGVAVEIHFTPSYMHAPWMNKRMQQWLSGQAEEQFSNRVGLPDGAGSIYVPTLEFNLIYQLCHVLHHFLKEGIGLRQLVDYHFVLKNAYGKVDVKEIEKTLKHVGLYQIARAVMYIEHELLGLEEKYLIVPENEKMGKFLIQEIMISGNFGIYDPRIKRSNSRLLRNISRLCRDVRLFRYFPSECLWEPIFRIYHFIWRQRHQV